MYEKDAPELFYSFADARREVCFHRYDMPTPWMNYLSNGTFTAMISHAGGGVAFYKSPQIFRINHYRFFHLPADRSGFYTYIRDGGSVWCPTSQPVAVKPDSWSSCHGMGYTRFRAEKDGLGVTVTYLVGERENALIWNLKFVSDRDRKIELYPFVELGMMEFMRELQWQCYNKHQLEVSWMEEAQALVYRYGVEAQPKPEETPLIYFGTDAAVHAYEGDRDEFIGPYRSEENPMGLEQEALGNSLLKGGDPCFALQLKLELKAGEESEVNVFLGAASDKQDIARALASCREKHFAEKEEAALEKRWEAYLGRFQCRVPDAETARMVNCWNPYQAHRNFLFSRNLSYYATGTFRGVGYRDTAQDILAVVPFDLAAAKEKTRLLLTQQYGDGHVNHYFFPVEGYEPVTSVHSDDHLWTVLTVWHIISEEGRLDFLKESIPYYDGGEGSVYEHLRKAIEFSAAHLGERGFPLMLRSDWNDALFRVCREGRGESIWTAMQLGLVLGRMEELARRMGDGETEHFCRKFYREQKELVNTLGWDGRWFRRAIMDSGEYVGTAGSGEARIWLNAQTWSVLSGMGDRERCRMAMDAVYEMLNTPLGIKKIEPPIVNFPSPEEPLTNYNPGTGENGSVFCHANTWAVIAECMLGNGDRAYEYYRQLIPAVAAGKAGIWRYKAEPYVYASNIFGPDSLRFGLANVSWLTGTAAWMYVAVSQYILGVRAVYEGLVVEPCLPSAWKQVHVTRKFREAVYEISMERGKEDSLTVDGRALEGRLIPYHEFGAGRHEVKLVTGPDSVKRNW